jgi:NADH-quinone oxidoreductase subunit E
VAKLSPETQEKIRDLKDKFPARRSAVLPSLHYAQAELGYLDDATLTEVAGLLELPQSMTTEVVGFYTMFDRQRRGKYKLEVCRNLSCALMGAKQLTQYLEKKLGVELGGTTPDGKFTLLETECLGACGYAPMMMVGPYFYENLTRDKVDAIVGALAEDREPSIRPAGYPEMDGETPKPIAKASSASGEIREGLAVSKGKP